MPGDIAGLAAGFGSRLGRYRAVRADAPRSGFLRRHARAPADDQRRGRPHRRRDQRAPRRGCPARTGSVLAGYDAPGWADVVADRTDEIVAGDVGLPGHGSRPAFRRARHARAVHAGISYRIEGSGPALMLLPFFLAPSQWAPAVERLARQFTVVTLGGAHLGGVATLGGPRPSADLPGDVQDPDRPVSAQAGGDDPRCRLRRGFARPVAGPDGLGKANPITAIDTNPASCYAKPKRWRRRRALDGLIRFSARQRRSVAVRRRIVRLHLLGDGAGGVRCRPRARRDDARGATGRAHRRDRAIDRPAAMVERRRARGAASAGCSPRRNRWGPGGVADASLYRRARQAGLRDLTCFPALVTLDRARGADLALSRGPPRRRSFRRRRLAAWQAAREVAAGQGLLFMAHPMHCVVGHKAAG